MFSVLGEHDISGNNIKITTPYSKTKEQNLNLKTTRTDIQ